LIGSIYGRLLGLAYALRYPANLRSLTTVGGLASVPLARVEMERLRRAIPLEVQERLDQHERAGTTADPEYQAAAMVFYRRYLCRLDPWPVELSRSFELTATHPVYPYMNGPSEFTITGTIRDLDLSGELGRITAPTLVLGGRYDEVTPRIASQIRDRVAGARGITFTESAHLPFWEEPALFLDVVDRFLKGVDADRRSNRAR
jgi:L-proline amide hydrolase